jgi:RHS repeat-associated protein
VAPRLALPPGQRPPPQAGRASAEALSGGAGAVVPIPLPQVRGAPALALSYSQGLENGPFGLGFGLNIGAISRATHPRVPRYTEADVFDDPSGEPLTPGLRRNGESWEPAGWPAQEDGVAYEVRVYRQRRDSGEERVERWCAADGSCFWKLRDNRGGTAVYGRSAAARVADPLDPARVARWLLEEDVDALGNLVAYSYRAEDGAGWGGWTPPGGFAQRYPDTISFANHEASGAPGFCFEIRFDYGDYEPLASLEPVRPWPLRADPVTSCREGFPVQTLRLCRNVLIVNRIPEGGPPHLNSILELGYEEDPVHTRLASARLRGVRGQGAGAETAALPPLGLSYTGFSADAEWRQVTLPDGSIPPAPLGPEGPAEMVLADLRGEGLPGLLATDPEGPLYFPPLGGGTVGAGEPLESFPELGGSGGAGFSWEDVEGDGRLSPVVLTDGVRGYFEDAEAGWAPFRPFGGVPAEAVSGAARWADLDGDGRADLLVQLAGSLRCYVDEGGAGFGAPIATPAAAWFPVLERGDERSVVLFADVLGDGLSHCVQVRDGAVRVWPNLGYGIFGAPYAMEGAPALGVELLPDRILLADLAGSGRADLVLLYPDRAELHRNRAGSGFLEPLRVPIPGGLDPLDRVGVADVEGRGQACLTIARAGPEGATSYLRLGGPRPAFLLSEIDDGIGATTSFSYRSSTEFYLADRAAGRPWATRLASPVTVVDRVEHHDAVGGVRSFEARQYRDGYYDPVERVFRGFGCVQEQDGKGLDPSLWCFPDSEEPAPDARLVRTWFDVGGAGEGGELGERFRAEQFDPGPGGVEAGPTVALAPIATEDSRTQRQARVAVEGLPLHAETYALGADGLPAAVPLTVEDHAYAIEMLQPAGGEAAGAFRVLGRESVSTDYEGVAADPRVEYDALLAWDEYGNPTSWATVFYPRRAPEAPGQEELRALLHEQEHLAIDDPETFLAGLSWEERLSELGGLDPPAGSAFDYAGLAAQVATASAPANRVPYGSPFTGGPQARAFSLLQTVFWDEAQDGPAPLGSSGRRGLLHHEREAVFPTGFPERAYGGRVDAATLSDEAGLNEEAGHWWEDGVTVSYLGAAGFFEPCAFRSPFQTAATATTVAYDPCLLFAVSVTDGYGFQATAQPDYVAVQAGTVTDVNGVATQGLYDPLGRLQVIAQHAQTSAGYRGDMDLANYRPQPIPTLEELTADPGRYLQGARMYFLQALDCADPAQAPAAMASVQATAYAGSPTASGPAATPLLTVTHLDGFGRTLEALERVEGAAAGSSGEWAWASHSRVDFDEAGRALRTYLPAFLADWRFAPPRERPFTGFAYDARDRLIREDDPKGFFTRTGYDDAWSERHYDADDTVTESRYYREHIDDPALPPAERRALQMAATFAGTPAVVKRDAQGFVVEEDALDIAAGGSILTAATRFEVDVRGLVSAVGDPRLGLAQPAVETEYDMLGRALRVRRAGAGESFFLRDATGRVIRRWTPRGALVETVFDSVLRRPLEELLEDGGVSARTKAYAYGEDRGALTVNRLVSVEDQCGRRDIPAYDLHGAPAEESWRFAAAFEGTLDWSAPGGVELLPETWTCGWERDPAGRLSAERCAEGSVLGYARYANGWLRGAGIEAAAPEAVAAGRFLAGGQPAGAVLANGLELAWEHDPLTLELTGARASGSSDLQDLTYTLDPVGNVCTVEDAAAATILGGSPQTLVKQLAYDARYRLLTAGGWESALGTPPWRDYEEAYQYDEAGNVLAIGHTAAGATEERTFDIAATSNRAVLASMVDPTHPVDSFFDPAGNLLGDEAGAGFAYDYEQRLEALAATAWYRYDEEGIRRRRRVLDGAGATDWFRVGSAFLVAGPGGTASAILGETHGETLFVAERPGLGQPPALRYCIPDRLGSVSAEADAAGGLLRYQDYLPYGEPSVAAGAGAAPTVDLGFSGKQRDPESGLDYFGARHYKPSWGRWLTTDPLGEAGGLNLYEYVEGNPATDRDPHGYSKGKPPARGIKVVEQFGRRKRKFGEIGHGGDIVSGRIGKRTLLAYRWWAALENFGRGIPRNYPISSKDFQVAAKDAFFHRRMTRSVFKAIANFVGLLRGHGIPHADTMLISPASGGRISTLVPLNYYPELEGWGEQQRKHREDKARRRGTPIVQVNDYSLNPVLTRNGTPVPERVWFVELTGLSTNTAYAKSKSNKATGSYTAKAYLVDYNTFDYDSLPRKGTSDRRVLKPLRQTSVPSFVRKFVRHEANLPAGFNLKF